MTPVTATTAGARAMTALRAFLDDLGYAQLYRCCAGDRLFPAERARAVTLANAIGGEPGQALGLLAFGEPVNADEASQGLVDLVDALAPAGLASSADGQLRLDEVVVIPVLGGMLLTPPPPTWHGPRGHGRAYVGEDSLLLAAALPDLDGRTVLDLGAGSGLQGILAGRNAAAVVCSDVEARSLELAAFNAQLNRRAAAVEVVAGDCYEPVAARRFDVIVALAPYLPSVPGTDDLAVSGGPDGMALLRRILEGAREHLCDGGELVALAQLLCDDGGPLLRHDLPSLARGLEARVICFDAHPLQPWALELATALAVTTGAGVEALLQAYLGSLRSIGATSVCSAFIRLRARPGVAAPPCTPPTVMRTGRLRASSVLAPAPGLRIGVDPELRSVVCSGRTHPLPVHVAALLAAFDGVRDLGEAARTAWGRPDGADPQDLLDQALERAGELERAGLLASLPVSSIAPPKAQPRRST